MPTKKPSVPVRRLVDASRSYVKSRVAAANKDGNKYLTRAEAKALPEDLRDNYTRFRASTSNLQVPVTRFADDFVAKVRSSAERADVNADGAVDRAEARLLPAELQDNFANFAGTGRPAAAKVVRELRNPLSAETLKVIRSAFASWVETDLTLRRPVGGGEFEYENQNWSELLHELGEDQHARLKREMLKLARTWSPGKHGFSESSGGGGRARDFYGNFEMITLWVGLERGKPPVFGSEID